jgi:hypothetical protein
MGVSVRATTPEKKIAAASWIANSRNKLSGVAGHEGERQEHRHQGGGGGDHREADLARPVEGGEERRLALLDAAMDVLDLDDGVVHHDADGEHHGEERQHVDGGAEEGDHHVGGDHRDRDRDDGDERRAPVAQEDQDHQHDERDALRAAP